MEGFEPATGRLEIFCSVPLSYTDMNKKEFRRTICTSPRPREGSPRSGIRALPELSNKTARQTIGANAGLYPAANANVLSERSISFLRQRSGNERAAQQPQRDFWQSQRWYLILQGHRHGLRVEVTLRYGSRPNKKKQKRQSETAAGTVLSFPTYACFKAREASDRL